MNRQDEALEVLLILRRRLLDRMAGVIVENRATLLNGRSHTNNPLTSNSDLAEMIRSLGELDRAITGMADIAGGVEATDATATRPVPATRSLFTRFVELVQGTRLEEASQELSRTLQMPLDRVTTATRFFARSLKTDTSLPAQLAHFCELLGGMNDSDAMRTIMRLFGFQAVEARVALQTLRAQTGSISASGPAR